MGHEPSYNIKSINVNSNYLVVNAGQALRIYRRGETSYNRLYYAFNLQI